MGFASTGILSAGEVTYEYQCFQRAGYLSGMQDVAAVFLGLLSLICTIVSTFRLRNTATKSLNLFILKAESNGSEATPATEHTSAAGAGTPEASTPPSTDTTSASNQTSTTDAPPPYNSRHPNTPILSPAPQTNSTTLLFGNAHTQDARWRAQTFALSTLYLALLTMSLTTVAFALQNLWYCPHIFASKDTVTFWMCLVWFLYAILVLFASSGLVAWIVKFLALWGPTTEAGRGRVLGQTIELDMAFYGLLLIPVGLGLGVVELVLACQRLCCPGASDEYVVLQTEDLEMGGVSRQ